MASRAVDALLQMQMIAVGRLQVKDALIVLDDSVARILRSQTALLGGLLNGGARQIISVETLTDNFNQISSTKYDKAVLLSSDMSKKVQEAQLLLEDTFERVEVHLAVGMNDLEKWLPLVAQPIPMLPQPTLLLTTRHKNPSNPVEFQAVAVQLCAVMECLSGSRYHVFSMGSRPKTLASMMREQQAKVARAFEDHSWTDDSDTSVAHVLILDREGDLICPTSVSAGSDVWSQMLWASSSKRVERVGDAQDETELDKCISSAVSKPTVKFFQGLAQLPAAAGLQLLREKIQEMLGDSAQLPEGGMSSNMVTAMRESLELRRKSLLGQDQIVLEELLSICTVLEEAKDMFEVEGQAGAVINQFASAFKMQDAAAADDSTGEEVLLQLTETADKATRGKKVNLRFRHVLQLTVRAFALLGQKGLSESLAKGGPEFEVLKGALASFATKIACSSPDSQVTGKDVGREVETLMDSLIKVARLHSRSCGEAAEAAGAEAKPESYQPLLKSVMRGVVESGHSLTSAYQHGAANSTSSPSSGTPQGQGDASTMSKAFAMGSTLLSSVSKTVQDQLGGEGQRFGEACEYVVVFVLGGVTVAETEELRQLGELPGGAKIVVSSTSLLSGSMAIDPLVQDLPILQGLLN